MIEGATWRRWVFFYTPLTGFIVVSAVPVLLDGHHHHSAGRRALSPVERGQLRPVLDLPSDAVAHHRPADADACSHLVAEHDDHRLVGDGDLAVLRPARGLCAVAAEVSVCRAPRHRHLHHLPGAADPAVHSARRHHPQFPSRRLAVGADPDLSDLSDPVLHLADDGLFQVHPEGTGGMRPHRRCAALEGDALHHFPDRRSRHFVRGNLCLHLVVERVHLRPCVSVLAREEDGVGRRHLRADPRRRLLSGAS